MNQSEFMTSLHGLLKLQSVETRIPTYICLQYHKNVSMLLKLFKSISYLIARKSIDRFYLLK